MDTAPPAAPRCRLCGAARLQRGIGPAQEGGEVQPAGIGRGHISRKGAQVFAPLGPVFHGARHGGPVCAGIRLFAHLVQRSAGRLGAQGAQHGGKALFFFPAALQHGGIQRALRAGQAQAARPSGEKPNMPLSITAAM